MSTATDPVPLATSAAEPVSTAKSLGRLRSLDAYRGFVMLLMASEGFGITRVAKHFKESPVWQQLAYQTDHVQWVGCSLWDLIQPSFMFMVGVALAFSIASRVAKGQSFTRMLLHAAFRALALVWLGIFLRSVSHIQTNFTFEDVLTQIGLGYVFLFLLVWTKPRTQAIVAFGILIAYWAAFAAWTVPPAGFDYASVGANGGLYLQGFAAHWGKNTNIAAAFDRWFLNLFPRLEEFKYNGGGYLTLSFIPSLATMIFGLLAGQLLRSSRPAGLKVAILVLAGLLCLGAGWALDAFGVCPIVKRIWTPSWVIFAGGWTCLLLAAFYAAIDLTGWTRWAFPLIVVGTNSIAMYCMAHLFDSFIRRSFTTHFGPHVFRFPAAEFEPITASAVTLIVLWLLCLWLYRKRVFIRI
ncbi:MAG: DUF5009 domain-containing protein [Planctomycetota bacterium]|nr:DUF5009 domain-containing protein [Planctomycetota bacterium]